LDHDFQKSVYEKLDRLNEQVTLLRIDVSGLKIKTGLIATLFGLIGGALSVVTIFIVEKFK
jgi:hypothetical protein